MREHNCPNCKSKAYKRNGYTRHAKQNHRCLDCGRQFSLETVEATEEAESENRMEGTMHTHSF